MSLVGNLEELGLSEILQIVSLSRKTGVLSLRSQGREGSIYFRQGQVVRAASSIFQQSLGEVLIQKGVIDLATLRKALAFQQEEGFRERLGSILIKHFKISLETVEEIVREQIENVVFTLFSWSDGTFEFHASTVAGNRTLTSGTRCRRERRKHDSPRRTCNDLRQMSVQFSGGEPTLSPIFPTITEMHYTAGWERPLSDRFRLSASAVYAAKHSQTSSLDNTNIPTFGGGQPFSVSA